MGEAIEYCKARDKTLLPLSAIPNFYVPGNPNCHHIGGILSKSDSKLVQINSVTRPYAELPILNCVLGAVKISFFF